ncbi:hypothetical protein EDC01DRAFT_623173 [Geopyxis carbonaria]|nr:hypothetical protein EDC01DRAFT_623173 [Geopyxis carbonaria]
MRASGRPGSHPALSGIAKIGLMLAANFPKLHSRPTFAPANGGGFLAMEEGEDPEEPSFWLYVSVAFFLVVLGGIFAGLTLGLMGQDEIYLQVIQQSGDGDEKKNATKVLRLLKRGKHWVLVTLLLSNVITNETLPIVLDRSLGGGWPAVLSSTILIVIFGEIIPQSVCVRYGLGIGAALSPFVLGLMYLMFPVAYPTAMLLDWILGEDHGTVYKKAGLKTLVTLHKTLGPSPSDRLNQDEVTIISAVLDLKDKPVGDIMTPIKDVYTMSADTVLDETCMHSILSAGYSRIPIHAPGEPTNFVGMLLVKVLITYDPEDGKKVGEFPLATLPETREETSCLDIVNFFQEGKSHMVLVSESPGENVGALGVVTLEDVIEELIGEEIVDESDVFIDVHKAIRRINPSPLSLGSGARRSISAHYLSRNADASAVAQTASAVAQSAAPNESTDLIISQSEDPSRSGTPAVAKDGHPKNIHGLSDDIIAHLTLGPANLAGRPRETKSKTVKIKTHTDGASPALVPKDVGVPYKDYGATVTSPTQLDGPGANPEPTFAEVVKGTPTPAPAPRRQGRRKKARSGSLIERIDYVDGVPKTVIETTSSSDDEDALEDIVEGEAKKRRSWGSSRSKGSGSGEQSPLLGAKK